MICSQKVSFPASPMGPRMPVSFTKSCRMPGGLGGRHPHPGGCRFPSLLLVVHGAAAGMGDERGSGSVQRHRDSPLPEAGPPAACPCGSNVCPGTGDPPPCSPAGARGTNLCRLEDFCLLFCFVLRCPCNCLLNPDCIIFIADDAQSRKALPWATQPGLVLLLRPSAVARRPAACSVLPAHGTAALCAGAGRTGVPLCPAVLSAAGGVNGRTAVPEERGSINNSEGEGTGSSLLLCRWGVPRRGASSSAARAGRCRGCNTPGPFIPVAGTWCVAPALPSPYSGSSPSPIPWGFSANGPISSFPLWRFRGRGPACPL